MLFHNGAVLHPWLVLVQSYNVLYHLSSSDWHRRENHHEEGLYRFDSRTIEVPCATCKFYHSILFFSLSWFSRAGRCPLNNKMRYLDNTNWEYERRVCASYKTEVQKLHYLSVVRVEPNHRKAFITPPIIGFSA